jgi:hypothetical protein
MAAFEQPCISTKQARDLVDQGDWAYYSQLREQIGRRFLDRHARLPPGHLDDKRSEELYAHSHKLLEAFPAQLIRDDWNPTVAGMRIGPGTVLNIGAGMREAIPHAIAFAMHVAAMATHDSIFYGTAALNLYLVMDSLKKMWVRIADPDEKLVFEAIAELSATLVVIDQAAHQREDMIVAYGRQAPLAEQIGAQVSGKLDAHAVAQALASLERQGILIESDGRWRIAL